MVKITPTTTSLAGQRIGQQVGVKPRPTATITPQAQQQIQTEVKQTQPQVDYESAWKQAKAHWLKGKAGAYLYHMSQETDPQTRAIYNYVKALDRETRAGNISPGRTSGSLLATPSEVAKQIANVEYFKRTEPTLAGGLQLPKEALLVSRPELTKAEYQKVEVARQSAAIKKARGIETDIFKPTRDTKIITTDRTIGSMAGYQQKYIESLKYTGPTPLSVQPYGGIRLPYGQKDVTWFEPTFGTITQEYPTGMKEVSLIGLMKEQEFVSPDISKPTDVTFKQQSDKLIKKIQEEEIKKANKVISDSVDKIQTKIDSGEISLTEGRKSIQRIQDTANVKLNEIINIRYAKELKAAQSTEEFKTKIAKSEKFRTTFKTSFDPEFKRSRALGRVELVADVSALGIPGAALPYFAAKGFYQAAKGEKEDIRQAYISPSGELITPRYMGLVSETKKGWLGIPYTTTTGLSEESRKAGMSFLFAGGGAFGQVSRTGRGITTLRAEELATKPWTTTSKELFKVGDTTMLRVKGSKGIGTASAEGEAMFPVKVGKGGKFKILAGEGKVDLRVVDFMKQGVYSPKEALLKSTTEFGLGGRGVVSKGFFRGEGFKIPHDVTKTFVTSGEGYVAPRSWQEVSIKQIKGKPREVSAFWKHILHPGQVKLLSQPKGVSSGWKHIMTKQQLKTISAPRYEFRGQYVGESSEQFLFGGLTRKEGEKLFFTSGKLKRVRLYPTFRGEAFEKIPFGKVDIKTAKRLGPEEYAKYLASEGKIRYTPSADIGKETAGIYFKDEGKPVIAISKRVIGEKLKKEVIRHELIHYKTPEAILKLGEKTLPYRLQPSEILAFGGEKLPIKFRGPLKEFVSGGEKVKLFARESKITGRFTPEAFGESLGESRTLGEGLKTFQRGKKSSSEFLRDMWKPTKEIKEKVIYPKITKITQPSARVVKPYQIMEGRPSIYSGTGQYERTNAVKVIGEQFGGTSFRTAETFAKSSLDIGIPRLSSKVISGVTIKTISKTKPIVKTETLIKQSSNLVPRVLTSTKTLQDVAVSQKSKVSQRVLPRQIMDVSTAFFRGFSGIPRGGKLGIGLGLPPVMFGGLPSKPISSQVTKQQGYKPQAKAKGGKWITLSKKPMTRSSALSRASKAADNTTSAQFRIKKVKGKVVNGIDNYFGVTQRKYRPYKIKKGKKIELHNQFIEKRGSRIDTRGEKQGLKLSKYAKQQGWLASTKKKGKKKTKSPWLI